MSDRLAFTKMHGIGNDFVVIDDLSAREGDAQKAFTELSTEQLIRLCDRRFGVGCDQLLWLKPPRDPKKADFWMDICNNDGTGAEMCGNGIRAVALYVHDRSRKFDSRGEPCAEPHRASYRVETGAGIKTVIIRTSSDGERMVEVDMGAPMSIEPETSIEVSTGKYTARPINVGNEHAVIFTGDVAKVPLETCGPEIEHHPKFPKKANVEFVQVAGEQRLLVRVWERGSGITLACGTGACAAAVAAIIEKRVKSPVKVQLPGGVLEISWSGKPEGSVFMTGPATKVAEGIYFV